MNTLRWIWVSALLTGAGAILAGCATAKSTPENRIEANRDLYDTWPVEMQEAIAQGRVMKGMTPEMVLMAKGQPTSIEKRADSDREEEVWVYGIKDTASRRPRISIGGNIGGSGIGIGVGAPIGGPAMSEDLEEVVFKDGVVLTSF